MISYSHHKYTLSDKLWTYLQNYAMKHKAAGNGFGYGIATRQGISRTLSARYYKDGSEILIAQEEVTGGLDEAEVNLLIQISEEKNLERKRNLEVNCGNLTTFHNALQENPDLPLPVQ